LCKQTQPLSLDGRQNNSFQPARLSLPFINVASYFILVENKALVAPLSLMVW
jgi:hypothetical protein